MRATLNQLSERTGLMRWTAALLLCGWLALAALGLAPSTARADHIGPHFNAPTNLRVTLGTDGFKLSWGCEYTCGGIDGVVIERSSAQPGEGPNTPGSHNDKRRLGGGRFHSHTDADGPVGGAFEPNRTYWYQVRWWSDIGGPITEGPGSGWVKATARSIAPQPRFLTRTDARRNNNRYHDVSLAWDAPNPSPTLLPADDSYSGYVVIEVDADGNRRGFSVDADTTQYAYTRWSGTPTPPGPVTISLATRRGPWMSQPVQFVIGQVVKPDPDRPRDVAVQLKPTGLQIAWSLNRRSGSAAAQHTLKRLTLQRALEGNPSSWSDLFDATSSTGNQRIDTQGYGNGRFVSRQAYSYRLVAVWVTKDTNAETTLHSRPASLTIPEYPTPTNLKRSDSDSSDSDLSQATLSWDAPTPSWSLVPALGRYYVNSWYTDRSGSDLYHHAELLGPDATSHWLQSQLEISRYSFQIVAVYGPYESLTVEFPAASGD